jgi:hypothetical protein
VVRCGYLICTVMLQYAGQGPAVLSYIDGKVEVLCLWVRENGNVCVCGGGGYIQSKRFSETLDSCSTPRKCWCWRFFFFFSEKKQTAGKGKPRVRRLQITEHERSLYAVIIGWTAAGLLAPHPEPPPPAIRV